MEVIKYPSIEQYRHVIQNMKHFRQTGLPDVLYRGTVKTHGTHGDIVFDGETITAQSRNNVLSEKSTNSGFHTFVVGVPREEMLEFLRAIETVCRRNPNFKFPIVIAGEWCGNGIQKGVGISELKRFFIFYNVAFGDSDNRTWVDIDEFPNIHLEDHRIFNIMDFSHYEITINFANPETAIDELKRITDEVERVCPVAKRIAALDDVDLKKTTGEGVVWVPIDPNYNSSRFWFKVKGDEHRVTKEGIVLAPEKVRTIREFLNKTVTVNRMEQGYNEVQQTLDAKDKKFNGAFAQWVFHDIMKEEHDTMEASGLVRKDIVSQINKRAMAWIWERKRSEA